MAHQARKPFGYYAEFERADGTIVRFQSTLRVSNENVVRLVLDRQAAKNNMTVVNVLVWEEEEEDPANASTEALKQFYEAEEKTNNSKKNNNNSVVVYTTPETPTYEPIEIPENLPKKGFASLCCFEKMQRTFPRGKAKDRREEYDVLFSVVKS